MTIPPKYEDVVAKLDAALAREAALRDELDCPFRIEHYSKRLIEGLKQRLTVAEQLETELIGLLKLSLLAVDDVAENCEDQADWATANSMHALSKRITSALKPAEHPQCEECKGWGYHENHYEGGGTACGECDGSGNAPVSVVMPEPYSLAMFQMISGFESVTPEQFDLVWSACREEVSRLNGIKP